MEIEELFWLHREILCSFFVYRGGSQMKHKKIMLHTFTTFLTLTLIFGFFWMKPVEKPGQSEHEATLKIGVLQLLSHPALDAIYQGLQDELASYSKEISVELNLLNAQGDQSNLSIMAKQFVKEEVDLLVGITTPSAQSLAYETKEIPIVLSGISYPVEAGLVESESHPGGNITGVSDRTPIKQQLFLMKEILPQLNKVGVLYTASEDNSVRQVQEFTQLAQEMELEVKAFAVNNSNDIQQVTETLSSQVEAIFIPVDNLLASSMPTVIQVTDQFRVPVFPSADTMVKDGGLVAIGVDQYQIGVETAKVILRIANGEKPEDMPIVLANQGIIYYNLAKAQQLGISLSSSILKNGQDLSE